MPSCPMSEVRMGPSSQHLGGRTRRHACFSQEETEAQGGAGTCSGTHSPYMLGLGIWPGASWTPEPIS